MIILKSHSDEKCRRGGFGLFQHPFSCKISKKNERGTLWRQKNSKKSLIAPKQIARGDPLISSGFVGYLEKVKKKRGNLWTKFALAGLGLRWFQDCF